MTDLEVERNAVSGLYGQTLIIILVTLSITGFGVYSILQIPLGPYQTLPITRSR